MSHLSFNKYPQTQSKYPTSTSNLSNSSFTAPPSQDSSASFRRSFRNLREVTLSLQEAGLTSASLIIGIDYTSSNKDQGKYTFGGKSLHTIDSRTQNPYQQVISIVGRTLAPLDSDGQIPAYGFGDLYTSSEAVFPICPEQLHNPRSYNTIGGSVCNGFEQVEQVYNAITPFVRLSGPTSFAPLIHQAIELVKYTREYHILVIVADGQVIDNGATERAVVLASNYALSIIVIGVGDGPWDMMEKFDDQLPTRRFDNFQFVNFAKSISGIADKEMQEANFAMQAMEELPDQYIALQRLRIL
jgi:E3 ubiquitin-protein ligase RGLG